MKAVSAATLIHSYYVKMNKSFFDGAKKQLKAVTRSNLWIIGVIVVLICIIGFLVFNNSSSSRSESYKDINGESAGLEASITYDACKKQPCDNKAAFNFNAYVFRDDGSQVAVIRPNESGKINAALPAGNYIIVLGKQLNKEVGFPQEPVTLKSGKTLELKLQYE